MAKTNLERELDLLTEFDEKQINKGAYIKKFFTELRGVGPVQGFPERQKNLISFFDVLSKIKSLNSEQATALRLYLGKLSSEFKTSIDHRLFLHQLHSHIKKFRLTNLGDFGIDTEQMLSSEVSCEITHKELELEPTRIIAFNKSDANNPEVMAALKIAYERHKDEKILITCSANDLKNFSEKCETLVLIGHGSFYRVGESKRGKMVTPEDVLKDRRGNTLGLGPYCGNIDLIVTSLSNHLKLMPRIKHCRILMCRAGAADEKLSLEGLKLYEKKHTKDPEMKSIMQVWDSSNPKVLAYDQNTLASAFWHKLFIDPERWMNDETDFALTVASSLIVPEVGKCSYAHGFFKVNDPLHMKHHNTMVATKYITVATASSSKYYERLEDHVQYKMLK